MTKASTYEYTGTEKMDLLEKSRWITALLDGSHKQGKGVLCKVGNRFCCLGVKADVDGLVQLDPTESGVIFFENPEKARTETYMYEDGIPNDLRGDVTYRPRTGGGPVEYLSVPSALASMNDHGWSFKRIAAWIDENL